MKLTKLIFDYLFFDLLYTYWDKYINFQNIQIYKCRHFKKKKLSKIRFELDKLDNDLLKIIKKRTNLVKKVLALKEKKNQIIDQKRIKTILINIKMKSLKNNIDPKITKRIWKNMIWSYIEFEKRNFKKK